MATIAGANVSRVELMRHLKQIDADLKQGVRTPEAVTVYGSSSFVNDHVQFSKSLGRYTQSTLGEMAQQCDRDRVQLERREADFAAHGMRRVMTSILGGIGLAVGGLVLAGTAGALAGQIAGGALAAVGFAGFGYGFFNIQGPWTYGRRQEIDAFEKSLDRWGHELDRPGLTVAAPSGSVRVDPTQITQSLTTEEKIKLAEQLLAEVKTTQARPTPTVARQDGTVTINGVQLPVNRS